jgi:hypothetical protein
MIEIIFLFRISRLVIVLGPPRLLSPGPKNLSPRPVGEEDVFKLITGIMSMRQLFNGMPLLPPQHFILADLQSRDDD